MKFKRIKVPKRQCYNYSKANWSALNREFGSISWHSVLDCMDPEISWSIFSKILLFYVDKFVPKMTVKVRINHLGLMLSASKNVKRRTNFIENLKLIKLFLTDSNSRMPQGI